jgi:hypothetical protein
MVAVLLVLVLVLLLMLVLVVTSLVCTWSNHITHHHQSSVR